MEAFATVEDLETRWRSLREDEVERAETLLLDATAYITALCRRGGVDVDSSDEVLQANLRSVCCAIVERIMDKDAGTVGVSNMSQTAGPYSQSFTYSNPNGDLYMTSAEKKLLGIGRVKVGAIRAKVAPFGKEFP